MGEVKPFVPNWRSRLHGRLDEPAHIIILPVVRVERQDSSELGPLSEDEIKQRNAVWERQLKRRYRRRSLKRGM
jgi:hypothetical protein